MILKSSTFGVLALSIPNLIFANTPQLDEWTNNNPRKENLRYPSIHDDIVAEVVGKSHFNLDRVMELVDHRPELARANWDWSFGDWESALGAASHVGRRDIANYLISKGARPNIFTFAMFGKYTVVKSMIDAIPQLKDIDGPHGISLLQHAQASLRSKELTVSQKSESEKLIAYLEEINKDKVQPEYIEMSEADKQKYLGDYKYGDGENDGFSVKLNMRKMLALGKLGKFGGGLYQIRPNVFSYNGIASVEIKFEVMDGKVLSLTIYEPDLVLKVVKV